MKALLVNHKVADFDTWLEAFQAHAEARRGAGVAHTIVWQSADDPQDVFVLMKAESLNGLRALTQSEDLKQTMMNAGVQPPVNFHFLDNAQKFEG